jgi:L-fuculose-phosphate aldolase
MDDEKTMTHEAERAEVVRVAREFEALDLTIGTSGNVSHRVPDGMLITPSTVPYGEIGPEDLIVMDLEGEVVDGNRLASVEHKVHLACYTLRPDVNGVIHSHPKVATAFAAARKPLPAFLDEFGVSVGKEVRVAPYAMSGSAEIAEGVQEALGEDSNAVFLASHGLVTVGTTLAKALMVARQVERAAETLLYAQMLGGPADLPEETQQFFSQVFQFYRTQDLT